MQQRPSRHGRLSNAPKGVRGLVKHRLPLFTLLSLLVVTGCSAAAHSDATHSATSPTQPSVSKIEQELGGLSSTAAPTTAPPTTPPPTTTTAPATPDDWYESYGQATATSINSDFEACLTIAEYAIGSVEDSGLAAPATPVTDACNQLIPSAQNALSGPQIPNAEAESYWQTFLKDEIAAGHADSAAAQQASNMSQAEADLENGETDETNAESQLSAMADVITSTSQ